MENYDMNNDCPNRNPVCDGRVCADPFKCDKMRSVREAALYDRDPGLQNRDNSADFNTNPYGRIEDLGRGSYGGLKSESFRGDYGELAGSYDRFPRYGGEGLQGGLYDSSTSLGESLGGYSNVSESYSEN